MQTVVAIVRVAGTKLSISSRKKKAEVQERRLRALKNPHSNRPLKSVTHPSGPYKSTKKLSLHRPGRGSNAKRKRNAEVLQLDNEFELIQ
jgi:hypothetical protein